jgi:hypothetical protein
MSCIGLIVIGSYHIINIGKVGATWMIVISIWDMSLGILFAAAQAHILTRRSRTPDRGRWLSVPLSEQLNEKLKQWSVFWVYFVICLIGLGLTIFLANKEWDKPKMVCVCGFTVGVTIAILVLLPMWDYVSPLGVCGNGKLGMKEWVLVACIAEMLLSPLFADLVVGIIAEKLMGLPKGQDQGVIGVHIGYIVSSMLPLAMV